MQCDVIISPSFGVKKILHWQWLVRDPRLSSLNRLNGSLALDEQMVMFSLLCSILKLVYGFDLWSHAHLMSKYTTTAMVVLRVCIFVEPLALHEQRVRCFTVLCFDARSVRSIKISPSLPIKIYYHAGDRSVFIFIKSMKNCRSLYTSRLHLFSLWSFGLLFFLPNRWWKPYPYVWMHVSLNLKMLFAGSL